MFSQGGLSDALVAAPQRAQRGKRREGLFTLFKALGEALVGHRRKKNHPNVFERVAQPQPRALCSTRPRIWSAAAGDAHRRRVESARGGNICSLPGEHLLGACRLERAGVEAVRRRRRGASRRRRLRCRPEFWEQRVHRRILHPHILVDLVSARARASLFRQWRVQTSASRDTSSTSVAGSYEKRYRKIQGQPSGAARYKSLQRTHSRGVGHHCSWHVARRLDGAERGGAGRRRRDGATRRYVARRRDGKKTTREPVARRGA